MFIRKPRGIGFAEIALVTIVGFFGGVYIWKPAFQKFLLDKKEAESDTPKDKEDQVEKPN